MVVNGAVLISRQSSAESSTISTRYFSLDSFAISPVYIKAGLR